MNARVLTYNALLWLSLGAEIGYFDPEAAEDVLERHFSLLKDLDEFMSLQGDVLASTGREWLDRLRYGGILRPDRSQSEESANVRDVVSVYFQSGMLLSARSIVRRDALASQWASDLSYASEKRWEKAILQEAESAVGDEDATPADEALTLLRYMDSCFDLLNSASQDERVNEFFVYQQFTVDLGTVLSWPLNLATERSRRRFREFFNLIIDNAGRESALDFDNVSAMRGEVMRLAAAWGDLARGAAAAAGAPA